MLWKSSFDLNIEKIAQFSSISKSGYPAQDRMKASKGDQRRSKHLETPFENVEDKSGKRLDLPSRSILSLAVSEDLVARDL